MKVPAKLVREWLAEFKSLPESELHTYANTVRHNDELISSLYGLLDEDLSSDCVEPVCHQLFEFYKSGHLELKRFTLELVPRLISTYLVASSRNEKKKCGGIESCLLGIYNLEVVDENGQPKVKTFTIPTLAKPSIYHEPPSLATLALTETSLLRYHSDEPILITIGPLPQVASINSQNRMSVLSYVMNIYNIDISKLSLKSHRTVCHMSSRLSKTGFDNLGYDESLTLNDSMSSASSRGSGLGPSRRSISFIKEPRISLSPDFLIELLHAIYFAMFNGEAQSGNQALEDVHLRASFELYPDVLLVTNAIQNSLRYNPSGQPQDGPMGISIALSPTQGNPAFSKHAITNASFRAKKLPDDLASSHDNLLSDENGEQVVGLEVEPPHYEAALHSPKSHKSSAQTLSPKAKSKPEKEAKKHVTDVRRSSSAKKERSKEKRESKEKVEYKENKRDSKRKDIDVPTDETELAEDAPPLYEELLEDKSRQEAATSSGTSGEKSSKSSMLGKPLRSIMKKSNERSKEKKDKLEIKKKDNADLHSPKSPKHSVSMSAGLGSSFNNGDITDPSMVNVQVVRSSSRTLVDQFEMKESRKSATMSAISSTHLQPQQRTSSLPEDGLSEEEPDIGANNHIKPILQPASHSKDLHGSMNNGGSIEKNGSVNTQL